MDDFGVLASSGSLRATGSDVHVLPHRWTPDGVAVEAAFTGAHLLHLAVAGCVLNDLYREAERLGVRLDGVRVRAWGGFDTGWRSTGIGYAVELDAPVAPETRAALLAAVDEVAEIPRAVRQGAAVTRAESA